MTGSACCRERARGETDDGASCGEAVRAYHACRSRREPDDRNSAAPARAASLTLKAEFALFYVIVPVAGAVLLPANAMFGLLFAMTALGLVLLQLTPGFHWHELTRGWGRIDWTRVAALALLTAVAAWAILRVTRPEAMFFLPRERPQLMLMIALLYPLLSALPQEIGMRRLCPIDFRGSSARPEGRVSF